MTERNRSLFEGVTKIIRFNTRFYIGSVFGMVAIAILLTALTLPLWLETLVVAGMSLMMFWTLSSLLVSWYVYDYVGVTRWEWMRSGLQCPPSRWANIHAGLDESTGSLRTLLPGTDGIAIDIYDPVRMKEPSIARARRLYPAKEPFQRGSAQTLPLPDGDCNAVFLLFAAHELRASADRTQLLREAHRVLKDDGQIFLVEHVRDLPNFVAFGPGFLHFHTGQSWLRSVNKAGFRVVKQREATPFVRCFTLSKADA